jgi:hypothetical protein
MQFDCIGFKPAGDVYYDYAADIVPAGLMTAPEFAACAGADLDGDGVLGQFELQTHNNNSIDNNIGLVDCAAVAGCMVGIIAWEVQDCMNGQF